MKNRKLIFIAISLVVILVLGSLALFQSNKKTNWSLKDYYAQALSWKSCADGFECASFLVPIDYDNLKSGNFKLRALRHRANKENLRIGSLVVNPGGPGGSGIDFAYNAPDIVSQAINDRYDVVGIDGRGVNKSDPIYCLSDKEQDAFINIDGEVNSEADLNKLISSSKNFVNSCVKAAGIKVGHVSTFESAKDMDILRALLGDTKLNYLGKSYGSYLGAIYITLFPKKVGRIILDGAIDPNISFSEQDLTQVASFERALDDYLAKNREYSKETIQKFIKQAKTSPLKSKSGRALTRSLVITSLAASLYDNTEGWDSLSKALQAAIKDGNPDLILGIADGYNNRDASGHYYNNENDIGIAINCLDWQRNKSVTQMRAESSKFVKASPTFGPYMGYSGLPCLYWPAPVKQPKLPFNNLKTEKFMIIGVTKDPATPYSWAVGLAKEFPNSILLTLQGEGHTGQNRGNSCIDNKVDDFLLAGNLPNSALTCK